MENEIQMLSFVVSFIFGICFAFLNELNKKIISKKKKQYKLIFSFLFIINITLLYLIINYYINNGVIHIYFLICVFLGYLFSFKKVKLLTNSIVNRIVLVLKKKR